MILVTHERCFDHDAGVAHPERPARLRAVLEGVAAADLDTDLVRLDAVPAPQAAVLGVHDPLLLGTLQSVDTAGGGRIDPDTAMNAASLEAAMLAAGAGLVALDALGEGLGEAAFCAVRPPGHHATPNRSMGFCLLNNVAVTARTLADRGERVLIVDYDAHHGNGTQDVFYDDPRVLFVSFHQSPLYPGTGGLTERGRGDGVGTNVNVPLPPGATGEHYRAAWDDVVAPIVDSFDPTWLLVSAGFDGHRADPITELGLTAGDFADLTLAVLESVGPQRRIVFLEGGYDLDALRGSTTAVVRALAGERHHPERPSSGGPGEEAVHAAARVHRTE